MLARNPKFIFFFSLEGKKFNSLTVLSIMTKGKLEKEPLKACPPASLQVWEEKHGVKERSRDKDCNFTIPELRKR